MLDVRACGRPLPDLLDGDGPRAAQHGTRRIFLVVAVCRRFDLLQRREYREILSVMGDLHNLDVRNVWPATTFFQASAALSNNDLVCVTFRLADTALSSRYPYVIGTGNNESLPRPYYNQSCDMA